MKIKEPQDWILAKDLKPGQGFRTETIRDAIRIVPCVRVSEMIDRSGHPQATNHILFLNPIMDVIGILENEERVWLKPVTLASRNE